MDGTPRSGAGATAGPARALAWLESRPETGPAELAEAVRETLEALGPGPADEAVAEALARGATEALDRVVGGGEQGRPAALPLLAADACLAYAFEAGAESGVDLRDLAARLGPRGLLGERLARALREAGPAARGVGG